jgi:hypothetical protein
MGLEKYNAAPRVSDRATAAYTGFVVPGSTRGWSSSHGSSDILAHTKKGSAVVCMRHEVVARGPGPRTVHPTQITSDTSLARPFHSAIPYRHLVHTSPILHRAPPLRCNAAISPSSVSAEQPRDGTTIAVHLQPSPPTATFSGSRASSTWPSSTRCSPPPFENSTLPSRGLRVNGAEISSRRVDWTTETDNDNRATSSF